MVWIFPIGVLLLTAIALFIIYQVESKAKCKDCGMPYNQSPLNTTIPDEQWELINPGSCYSGILCANCMVKRASKLLDVVAARMVFETKEIPDEFIGKGKFVKGR